MSLQLRTGPMLLDYLDQEMAWRIKEIHQFRTAVDQARGRNVDAHIRAGVSMLYAHWEGFIKSAANAYVNYLSYRADRNKELLPCFVALGMKTKLASANSSSKAEIAVEAVTFLLNEMDQPVRLPRAEAISAESNLSSTVFLNITGWIGIDSNQYSTRFPLIDNTLLKSRNNIAHGEFLTITREGFYELIADVLEMLRWFKTDIENAVAGQTFLKA
jgi:hypothetical protein